MTRRFVLAAFLTAAAVAAPASPIADVICAPREEMEDRLRFRFGETRQGSGIRDPETIMELWASERGTWTMVLSYADGRACIVAMGEGWGGPMVGPA